MALSKKSKKILVVVAILIALVIATVFLFSTMQTGISQSCKGNIGTGIFQGSNPVAGGCVIAPWGESDSRKYFTDGDEIVVDCAFSGDTGGGTHTIVSTAKYPYACAVLRHGFENGRDFWCNIMEDYCEMPSNSGKQVLCGSHIFMPGAQNKVGGSMVALENGSAYHLVPEDTSVTATCQSFSSQMFESSNTWSYNGLIYFHSVPKISCGDKITATNDATPIEGLERKQEFSLRSTCSGTAVIGFDTPKIELSLGSSADVGYKANGQGKCDIYLQNTGSGEQAQCVIDVTEFVQQQPSEEKPADIGVISENAPVEPAKSNTLLIVSGVAGALLIILLIVYFIRRRK